MVRQTRSWVIGISIWVTPKGFSALSTALTAAGGAAQVPLSPHPLTPSGLVLHGTEWEPTSMVGNCQARGTL